MKNVFVPVDDMFLPWVCVDNIQMGNLACGVRNVRKRFDQGDRNFINFTVIIL